MNGTHSDLVKQASAINLIADVIQGINLVCDVAEVSVNAADMADYRDTLLNHIAIYSEAMAKANGNLPAELCTKSAEAFTRISFVFSR